MNVPAKFSVVVPTCGRRELEVCLAAVDRLDPRPCEVVVVDSAPKNEAVRELAGRWHMRYLAEPRPGAARARNRGAREATGDLVAFTDDDAEPRRDWLAALLPEFADPRVALVTGQIVAPDVLAPLACAEQERHAALYRTCGFTGLGDARCTLDRDAPDWFTRANFLPFGIAPNLAIRRSVLQQWKGFDERLGPGTLVPGHEEQRAFHELIELGYRIVYQPESRVVHPSVPRTEEELRYRSLLRMQSAMAYMTLLLLEEPLHRREVLAYACGKFRGRFRQESETVPIPLWRTAASRLYGVSLYFRSRAADRG